MKIALEIYLKGENLELRIKNKSRFTTHGFGLFLEKYNPKEIAITDKARVALLQQSYLRGLRPIEFFDGNIIGFCATVFPVTEASVHSDKVKKLITQFSKLKLEKKGNPTQ